MYDMSMKTMVFFFPFFSLDTKCESKTCLLSAILRGSEQSHPNCPRFRAQSILEKKPSPFPWRRLVYAMIPSDHCFRLAPISTAVKGG